MQLKYHGFKLGGLFGHTAVSKTYKVSVKVSVSVGNA